jgi:hypothetical protein
MKKYCGNRGIAPLILNLGNRWKWLVSFTPRPLYPQGKSPWHPLDRRLMGPRAVLEAVVKKKIPSPRGESYPRTPTVQPIGQHYTDWAITALATKTYPCLTKHRDTETYGGDPGILNVCTRWQWAVSFTPRPIYSQGKSRRYAFGKRLGGTQSRCGRGDVDKKYLSRPCRESNPHRSHMNPVTILSEPPWILWQCNANYSYSDLWIGKMKNTCGLQEFVQTDWENTDRKAEIQTWDLSNMKQMSNFELFQNILTWGETERFLGEEVVDYLKPLHQNSPG